MKDSAGAAPFAHLLDAQGWCAPYSSRQHSELQGSWQSNSWGVPFLRRLFLRMRCAPELTSAALCQTWGACSAPQLRRVLVNGTRWNAGLWVSARSSGAENLYAQQYFPREESAAEIYAVWRNAVPQPAHRWYP